jgi:hypothetical protein
MFIGAGDLIENHLKWVLTLGMPRSSGIALHFSIDESVHSVNRPLQTEQK